jgi:hypothetical protein
VDFKATGQLLIIYSAFVKYLRKNGSTTKQCISYLQTSRQLMIHYEVLYHILIEYGTTTKLVRLTKMCLNETYNRVRVGKHLSDIFPVKNILKDGDALTPSLFNFSSQYPIRSVQITQDDLKWNGTHQFLVYADDVNIWRGSVYPIKKNIGALVVASKETGLEMNADKLSI